MTKNYTETYARNWPIIPLNVQEKLSQLRVAVAGCGSTGGGFIEGLVRLGVQHFHLTDNGAYERNNLNRQFVFLSDIGINKATTHARRILAMNPEAKVRVWDEGLTEKNVYNFVSDCDFIFDAVDVTTHAGIAMKLRLHEVLHEKKIPTGSALDLGYTQWLQSYNYHRGDDVLKGKLGRARACRNPLHALIEGFSSIEELPLEISEELIRLFENPHESACQLACACFQLAAMVTPYMIHFVKTGELHQLVAMDILDPFMPEAEKRGRLAKTEECHRRLAAILAGADQKVA